MKDRMKSHLLYLAHPYSSGGCSRPENVARSIRITNKLLDKGFLIFNPLTHSHSLDVIQKRDSEFWYNYDIEILQKCDGIIMCKGWKDSYGCQLEYTRATLIQQIKDSTFEILYVEDLV